MLLFLLTLPSPAVNSFVLRLTAFNGLLYGLFNLHHWAMPETGWLGVMHVPLVSAFQCCFVLCSLASTAEAKIRITEEESWKINF